MREKPCLKVTKNYDLFELHPFNRDLHKDALLKTSMKENGFMPSSPIHCVRNGNGKLKIIRGHHRFANAKELGLPVWYVIDESNVDLFLLEGSSRSRWSVLDFATARAHAGDHHCERLLDFQRKHHLTIGAAAALLGGEGGGSNNKINYLRTGTFEVGDMKHAFQVVRVTDRCRELKIPFATSRAFVAAISSAIRVSEFDLDVFIHRLDLHGAQMKKRSTAGDYLEEIEALYNYGAHKLRRPIAFRAREVSRARQLSFGASNN